MKNRILEISYDPHAKAGYISLSGKAIAKTLEFGDSLYLDLDRKGQPVGVEVLLVPDRKVNRQLRFSLSQLAREYHMPELRRLHPEKLAEIFHPA